MAAIKFGDQTFHLNVDSDLQTVNRVSLALADEIRRLQRSAISRTETYCAKTRHDLIQKSHQWRCVYRVLQSVVELKRSTIDHQNAELFQKLVEPLMIVALANLLNYTKED